jgi:hypothetical protein
LKYTVRPSSIRIKNFHCALVSVDKIYASASPMRNKDEHKYNSKGADSFDKTNNANCNLSFLL